MGRRQLYICSPQVSRKLGGSYCPQHCQTATLSVSTAQGVHLMLLPLLRRLPGRDDRRGTMGGAPPDAGGGPAAFCAACG